MLVCRANVTEAHHPQPEVQPSPLLTTQPARGSQYLHDQTRLMTSDAGRSTECGSVDEFIRERQWPPNRLSRC